MWTVPAVQLSVWEGLMVIAGVSFLNYIALLDSRWTSNTVRSEDEGRLSATDPRLIDRIRHQLIPPSAGPVNLTHPNLIDPSQHGNADYVLALTKNKTGGFFIECGAYDGETLSTTLKLERQFGWTGLLMEPSRRDFAKLVPKKRNSWLLEACVSDKPYAYTAQFQGEGMGKLKDDEETHSDVTEHGSNKDQYGVSCYPLASILTALGSPTVDFFSLDIEGLELSVLASFPWHQFDIKIVTAEVYVDPRCNPQTAGIIDVMESHGYWAEPLAVDWIFVKKDAEFSREAVRTIRQIRQQKFAKIDASVSDELDRCSSWCQGEEVEYKMGLLS